MKSTKATATAEGSKLINDAITAHRIVLFVKPDCPYCDIATRTLSSHIGALSVTPGCHPPDGVVVTLQSTPIGEAARDALAMHTGSSTLPAVFLDSAYIGGATETVQLSRNGILRATLRRLSGCATQSDS